MTEKTVTKVIIIRESLATSIASDCFTFAMLASLIGIGIALDSGAMQWTGALMAMIGLAVKAAGKTDRVTIDEARAKLDQLERDAS